MIKYRLHNITDFGVEIHDFCTENALNNYIAIFVDMPYWVENLEANEIIYQGCNVVGSKHPHILVDDGLMCDVNSLYPSYIDCIKSDNSNVSRETLHETPTEWIARHIPTEEKEACTKSEKIFYFLYVVSVIIMTTLLLYFFLSSVSFIAEYFSDFTWKVFNIL